MRCANVDALCRFTTVNSNQMSLQYNHKTNCQESVDLGKNSKETVKFYLKATNTRRVTCIKA